jgi:hypothetical protein
MVALTAILSVQERLMYIVKTEVGLVPTGIVASAHKTRLSGHPYFCLPPQPFSRPYIWRSERRLLPFTKDGFTYTGLNSVSQGKGAAPLGLSALA